MPLQTLMPDSLDEPSPAQPVAPTGWCSEEFAEIYREHSRPIYYLTLRFLGSPAQAEDAMHDVFLKAYRKMAQFRGKSAVRTWLYRIAINHCQNLRQAWHHRNILPSGDDVDLDAAGGQSENPLRLLETKELGARIQQALDGLSEEYRLLLLLVADEELSYDEIGQLTEQTPDAVRGKLHRARKAFQLHFARTA